MYRRRNSNEVLQEEQQNGIMSDSGTALPDRAAPSTSASSSAGGAKQKRKNFRKSNSVEPRSGNHQRKKSFSSFWDKLFSSKSTNSTTEQNGGNRLSGVSIESTSFESVNTILSTNSFTFVNPKKCKGKHVKGKRIPVQDDEGNKTVVVGHRGVKKKVGTLTRIGMKMGLKSKYNLQSCESLHHLSYLETASNFGTLGSTYRKKRRAPPPPRDLPENEQENFEPQQLRQPVPSEQKMQTKQQPKKPQELPHQLIQRPEPPVATPEQPPAAVIPTPPSPKPSTSRAAQNSNNFDPKTFKIYPRHRRSSSDGPSLTPARSSPVQSTSQTLNRTKFHVRGKRKAPAPPNPFGDPDAPEETEEQEEPEEPLQVSLTSTNENVPKTQNSVLNSPTRQSGPSSSSHVSNTTNNHATVNTEVPENNANTNLQQQQSLASSTATTTTPPSIQIENEDEIFQNNLNEQLFQEQEKEQQQQQQQQEQPQNDAQPGPSRLSQAPTEQQLAAAQRELQVLMTVGNNAPQPKTWLDERTKQELLELKREAEKSPLLFLRSKSKANGSGKNSRNSSIEVRNSTALSPSVSPTPEQQQQRQQTEEVYGETKKLTPKPWYKRSSSSSSSEKKNKKILQPYSGMTKFSDIEREANRIVEEQRRRSAEQGFHDSARELITMFNSFNENQRTAGSAGPTDENSSNVELEGQMQQPVTSVPSATTQTASTVATPSTAVSAVVQSSPRARTSTVPASITSGPVNKTTMGPVSTTTTGTVNSIPSSSSARTSSSGETPKMAIVRPQSSPQPKLTTAAAATANTTVPTTSASKLSTGVPTFANYPIIQRREDWICSRCTLKNAAWRLTCEACYQSSIHKISAVFESTSGSTTTATSSASVNTDSTATKATITTAITSTTTSASNATTTTTSSSSTAPVCANFIPQVTAKVAAKDENKEGVKLDSNDGGEELGIEQLRLQRLAFFGKQSTPSGLAEAGASETEIPQPQTQSVQPVVAAATEVEPEEKRSSQIFSDDEDDTIDELIGLQRPTTKVKTPDPPEPEQPDLSNMPTFGPRNWNPFQMNRFRPMLESIVEQSQDVYARIDAPYYENWEFGQGPPHLVNMPMVGDGRNWMTNTFMQNYPHNNLPNTDNNVTANFSPNYYSNSESSSCSECEATGNHSRTEVMDGKNRESSRRHSQHHSRHFYGFYPSSSNDPSDSQSKLSLEDYRKLGAIPKYLLDQDERLRSEERSRHHHHHHHSHSRRHSSALDEQSRASPSLGKGSEDRARGNTSVEVEKLLRRLEWAIAEGDHKLAATLAHDLALLKVNCVVAKEDDMTKPITIRVYVEDRFMQQGPFQVQVTKIMTVKELKQKIESDWSIPLAFQKWILGRKMSESDDQKLLDFEISHDDMAFLYLVTPQIDPEPPVPPKPAAMSKAAPVKSSAAGPSGSQVRPQQPANLPAKKPAQALPAPKEVTQEAYVNVVPPKTVATANKVINVPQSQASSAKAKNDASVSETAVKKVTAGVQATASAPSPVSKSPVLPPKSAALATATPAAAVPITSVPKAQVAPPLHEAKVSSRQVQPVPEAPPKVQAQTKQYQPPQLPPKATTEVIQSSVPQTQKPLNPPKEAAAASVTNTKLAAKSPKIVSPIQVDSKPAPSKTTPQAASVAVPAKPTEASKVTVTKVTEETKEPLKEVAKPPVGPAGTNFNSTPKPFKPLATTTAASVPSPQVQPAPAPSPVASSKPQTSPQPQKAAPAKQLPPKIDSSIAPKSALTVTAVQKPVAMTNVVAAKPAQKALEPKTPALQTSTPAVITKVTPATNMPTAPSTPSTTKTSSNSPAAIPPKNNALAVAKTDTEPVPMRRTKKKQTDPGARNSITPEPSSSDAESTPKRHSSPVPILHLPTQQPVAKVAIESQPAPLPLLPENKQITEEIKPKTPTESPKPKRAQVQKVEAGCQSTLPLPTKTVKPPPKQATDPPSEVSIVSTTNVHVPGKEEAAAEAAGPAVILKDDVGTADPKIVEKPDKNKENNAAEAYNQMLQLLEKSDLIFNSEEFDCPVCFSNVGVNDGVVLRECLHSFCKECLIGSVQYAEEPEVKCPYRDDKYSCNSLVQEREIKALVPPEIFERHLAKSVKIAEGKIANTFHCRTADCAGWCVFEDDVNIFLCPVCKKRNCLTCQAIHDGMDCQQYQRQLAIDSETDENAKSSRLMLEKMIQRGEALECPACHVVLLKKWGCDWVRCSYCKTEICWITKGFRWGPNGKGDTSGGCKCGVNGVRCHPKCTYCH